MIKDLKAGTHLNQVSFGVINLEEKNTRQGKPFKDVTLSDKSGVIKAKIWSDSFSLCQVEAGKVICLKGRVGEYQGNLDLTIEESQITSEGITDFQHLQPALVFDIETVGQVFTSLGEWEQDYFLNNLEKNTTNRSEAKNKTGLYAFFGFVCSIAAKDTTTGQGTVFHLCDVSLNNPKGFEVKTFSEESNLLEAFWVLCGQYQTFISFNGSGFDFPYLFLRSALKRVKVPIRMSNLDRSQHVDLSQKFTQGGRSFKLEALTRFFGLSNPKEKGVSGLHVSNLYKKGEHQAIVDYVSRDVDSTHQLYDLYRQTFQ